MDTTQEAARQRLHKALEITGWPSTRLAHEAGVAPSTLNRFLNQDVGHTISLKTMTKVDDAVRRHLDKEPPGPDTIRKQIEYFRTAPQALEPATANMISLHVRGAVQAGHWAAAMEWPVDDWQKITLPRPDGHRSYFGLKVNGPSMNLVYPEGTILVCVPIMDYDHALDDGDHVIVQRWESGEVEATVKEMRHTGDGAVWLWPRSDHPEHQAPIELPPAAHPANDAGDINQSNTIQIVAVVVADYRVRTRKPRPRT